MSRVLVTGSQGFVGRHLVEYLMGCNYDVYEYDLALGDGDDLRNYENIRSYIELVNPDYVYHLAAQAWPRESLTDPRRAFDVNVMGTLNLLEALRNLGSHAKVLLAGTAEEYGYETQPAGIEVVETANCYPVTPYGVSKLAQTQLGLVYGRKYGLHIVCTRAYNHIGPGQTSVYAVPSFAKRIVEVENGLIPAVTHGDLSTIRNFTDVRDVIRAYRRVIDAEPGIYNVCSGQNVTMQYVLDQMISLAKCHIPTELKSDLGWSTSEHYPIPSHQKLTIATGWEPKIELKTSLEDVLNYWRSR